MPQLIIGLIIIGVVIALIWAAIALTLTLIAGVFAMLAYMTEGISSVISLGPVIGWFIVWSAIGCAGAAIISNGRLQQTLPSAPLVGVQKTVNKAGLHCLIIVFFAISSLVGIFVYGAPF